MRIFNHKDSGISILGVLFLGFLLVLLLSYFHISIKSVVDNPDTRENFNYVVVTSRDLWREYLKKPTTYLWNLFLWSIKYIRESQLIDINPTILSPKSYTSE